MVDDSVMFYHDVGTCLEELRDQRGDLFRTVLMYGRREPSGIREKDRNFGEVTRLPMDVSNVAEIWVLLAPVHTKKPPGAASPAYEMGLPVQAQHRFPEPALRGWVLDHAGTQRVAVVDKAMV